MPASTASTDLIRSAVKSSGLSTVQFAATVAAGRGERSIRRWLDGGEMSDGALDWLRRLQSVDVGDDVVVIRVARQ